MVAIFQCGLSTFFAAMPETPTQFECVMKSTKWPFGGVAAIESLVPHCNSLYLHAEAMFEATRLRTAYFKGWCASNISY